jgi:hypothetical protein
MRHVTALAAAIMMIAIGTSVAQESSGQMDSEALRKAVGGRTTYVGSERDRGRWWVVADKLCQRWNRWLDAKSYCFKLRQQEGRTVHWTRNDGVSGIATIAR